MPDVWLDTVTPKISIVIHSLLPLLQRKGYSTLVTAKKQTQTTDLLDTLKVPYRKVGDYGETLKEKISDFGARVIEPSGFLKIKDRIYTTGEIIGKYDGQPMSEQALVVSSKRGLVIITGCAHPGIVPMVEKVKDQFGEKIYMVMGGFHLLDKDKDEIAAVIKKFKSLGVTKIGPTHCTGDLATRLLRDAYQGNFMDICERACIEIPDP